MPDDKTKKIPQDADRVDSNDPNEIAYWCNKINCTLEQLKQAVKNVGVMADDVEREIKRLKSLNRGMGM